MLSYTKAWKFIKENQLRWYFLFPLALNVLLFVVAWNWVGGFTGVFTEWLMELFGLQEGGSYYESVGTIIWWLVLILLKIFLFIAFHFIAGGVVLALMSPVLAYLSEHTERIITGRDYPFNVIQFVRDMLRGLFIATRNTIIQLFYIMLLMLLAFVPVLGWASPFVVFVVSSYFYGFSFMDYTCERKKLPVKQSVEFIRKNKGIAIANGAIYSLAVMVPYIGAGMAGFVAIVSVIAATLAIYESEQKQKFI